MIKKFEEFINEGIKDYLKPKSEAEVLDSIKDLSPSEILNKSVLFDIKFGFKYLCDNNLVNKTTKYIIEKYIFDKHQDEIKPYEKWLINKINNSEIQKSKKDKFYKEDVIRYKGDMIYFQYNQTRDLLYYNYEIQDILNEKFNLNEDISQILIIGIAKKYLNNPKHISGEYLSCWINVR